MLYLHGDGMGKAFLGILTPAVSARRVNERLLLVVAVQVQCSLRQMLENGFFHADPHAGT